MLKERAQQVSLMVAVLDMTLLAIAFLTAFYLRSVILTAQFETLSSMNLGNHLWMLFASLPIFHVLFRAFNLYDSFRTVSYPRTLVLVGRPFLLGAPLLGSLVFLVQDKMFSRPLFVAYLLIGYTLITLEKMAIQLVQREVRRQGFNYRRVLMVGVGPEARPLAQLLQEQAHLGMRLIGHITLPGEPVDPGLSSQVLGEIDSLSAVLDEHVVDEVFFAVRPGVMASLEPHIRKCEEVGVRVHLRADFFSTLISRTYTSDIDGMPILTFSSTPQRGYLLLVKRTMDLTISSLGIVILSPLMAAIALAIKYTSTGPVFFRQERTGLNGRRFSLLKFRSMRVDADKEQEQLAALNEASGPVFKIKNDPRVTSVGRWLRRLSLDELPQLWNILRGDMSLVGPRPPIPQEVEKYHRWQRRRLSMKPGLTCLWQINGRSALDFDTWMKLDMEYIDNWSLSLDLKILARTVAAVLLARGAH